MANVLVDETSLQGIANAIRGKNGTQNTYTPSQMASAISAIPSGSGSTSWTLLGSTELEVNTTNTTATLVGYISCGASAYTKDKIIYVRVRDKAGKRTGYFLGSDCFFINYLKANNKSTALTTGLRMTHRYSNNAYSLTASGSTTGYGVYGYSISSSGQVNIYSRYNSSYSLTIDGTYVVEVYALDYPDGKSVFDI